MPSPFGEEFPEFCPKKNFRAKWQWSVLFLLEKDNIAKRKKKDGLATDVLSNMI